MGLLHIMCANICFCRTYSYELKISCYTIPVSFLLTPYLIYMLAHLLEYEKNM